MSQPTKPLRHALPAKDQASPRMAEFVDMLDEVMRSLVQHGERRLPYYDLARMEADTVFGLRDLKRVASILGVKVRSRFGRGLNLSESEEAARDRKVYRRAIETATDFYKSKGLPKTIRMIGYVLGLSLTGRELNTTDYLTFVPDEEQPVGKSHRVIGEGTWNGDGTTTVFETFGVSNPAIVPGTLRIYGEGFSMVYDNENGELIGGGSGTVDYGNGEIHVTFAAPPDNGSTVFLTYETTDQEFGAFYYRSPHYQVEVDWLASISEFEFTALYDPETLAEDLRNSLEEIRPAHVVFKIIYTIAMRHRMMINACAWWGRSMHFPADIYDFDPEEVTGICWDGGDGTYLVRVGEGTRADFYIAGVKVADFSYFGMRTVGAVTSQIGDTSAWDIQNWIASDGDYFFYHEAGQCVYFGYWDGAQWVSFARLHLDGRFETTAEIVSQVRRDPLPPCVSTDGDGTLYISGNPAYAPFFYFTTATDAIYLAGARIEEVTL
jgi:hypothetical protein